MGEPVRKRRLHGDAEVYPHRYGGTASQSDQGQMGRGLSPQVWGNPLVVLLGESLIWSIPTGMGEPSSRLIQQLGSRVYPHRYGGTFQGLILERLPCGLSPQVWGNRVGFGSVDEHIGSIPTGMGEPIIEVGIGVDCGVYPHRYGGTTSVVLLALAHQGLSPQVWGNLFPTPIGAKERGSIPTGMGEPATWKFGSALCRVYPHRYGGTWRYMAVTRADTGLSPQVWGNHSG